MDPNVAALEAIKMALDMPGTGSYVEWAKELREIYDIMRLDISDISDLEQLQERVAGPNRGER